MDSSDAEIDSRRLHHELEHAIKEINKEQISIAAGVLKREDFIQVAQMVACLRARYISNILELAKRSGPTCIDTESALELKSLREAYQEALTGFDALEHALKREYVTFSA